MNIEQGINKYFSLLTSLTKNTFSIHNIYFESKQYCVPFLCEFEI
jgi:hypothetical protein